MALQAHTSTILSVPQSLFISLHSINQCIGVVVTAFSLFQSLILHSLSYHEAAETNFPWAIHLYQSLMSLFLIYSIMTKQNFLGRSSLSILDITILLILRCQRQIFSYHLPRLSPDIKGILSSGTIQRQPFFCPSVCVRHRPGRYALCNKKLLETLDSLSIPSWDWWYSCLSVLIYRLPLRLKETGFFF